MNSFRPVFHSLIRLFAYSLISLFAFTPQIFAKTLENLGGPDKDVATIQSLETLFGNLVTTIVSLSGIALFVMLLVGGFKFLFSAGDQKQLEEARGTITNAIIGLVVIVAAYLILRTIATFTGTNVTNFNLNIQ